MPTQTKRQRIREHRKRILEGLIETLYNDLYGNGATYIYGDVDEPEDEQREAEARKAGESILKQLKGLIHR